MYGLFYSSQNILSLVTSYFLTWLSLNDKPFLSDWWLVKKYRMHTVLLSLVTLICFSLFFFLGIVEPGFHIRKITDTFNFSDLFPAVPDNCSEDIVSSCFHKSVIMSRIVQKQQHLWSSRIFSTWKAGFSQASLCFNDSYDWFSAFLQTQIIVGLYVCKFLKSHKQINDQQPAFECQSFF